MQLHIKNTSSLCDWVKYQMTTKITSNKRNQSVLKLVQTRLFNKLYNLK